MNKKKTNAKTIKNRKPMTSQEKTRFLTEAGIIAALYAVITFANMGLSAGAIQIRISEALCILPCFTAAAVPGLFVGCIFANLITGGVVWDVIFGSLTTLLAAFLTRQFKDKRFLASVPPIVCNMFVIPIILSKAYGSEQAIGALSLSVGIGEFISAGVIGQIIYSVLDKNRHIFKS